jgi:hypothetical protein
MEKAAWCFTLAITPLPPPALKTSTAFVCMNAFLTPSNTNCSILTYLPLAVKLVGFSGLLQNKTVMLNWSVADDETAERFEVEQSPDGRNFTLCRTLAGTAKNGHETLSVHPAAKYLPALLPVANYQ